MVLSNSVVLSGGREWFCTHLAISGAVTSFHDLGEYGEMLLESSVKTRSNIKYPTVHRAFLHN